jgi:hypothetical protein
MLQRRSSLFLAAHCGTIGSRSDFGFDIATNDSLRCGRGRHIGEHGGEGTQPAMPTRPDVAAQVRRPLDALNFFLADVRDGLGPYLAIYLLTVQHWDEASISW